MFNPPLLSLFAASVRPQLWPAFFASLEANELPFEVVFAGNLPDEVVKQYAPKWGPQQDRSFHYIPLGNIKPAQSYALAAQACEGELIHWTADDAEYAPGLLDRIWAVWDRLQNSRAVLSCQTIEDGNFVMLEWHRLFGRAFHTPQMAPLGFMSRKLWRELGGIDRRFISGQWDNDLVMRAMNAGAFVEAIVDQGEVSLDHRRKHGGNAGTFRTAYQHDRRILEGAWAPEGRDTVFGKPPYKRYDAGFEPFDLSAPDATTKSQGPNGMWQ